MPAGRHRLPRPRRTASLLLLGLVAGAAPLLTPSGAGAAVASYVTEVQADAPSAWWRLGEAPGSTVAKDASGHGRQGTYSGGVTLGTGGAIAADPDTAAAFDGASGAVTVPDASPLRLNGAFTVELWARSPGYVGTAPGLLAKGSGARRDGYVLQQTAAGALVFTRNGTTARTPDGVLVADRYRHLALTYDGSAVRWYVDGALASTTARSYPTSSGTAALLLGQGSRPGASSLDEVATYPRALSAARLAAHAAAGRAASAPNPSPSPSASPSATASPTASPTTSPTTSPTASPTPSPTGYPAAVTADAPVAWWRLGEAPGATLAADATGHGSTGTYSGGVTLGTPGALAGADTAAAFDGATGRVTVPDAPALRLNGAFSIELWARSPRFVNTYPGLLVKGSSGTADGYLVYQTPAGGLVLKRGDLYAAAPDGSLVADRFRHLAATYDGTSVRWYVDGALVSTSARTFPVSAGTAPLVLGQGDEPGSSTLDEVALYATALPAARIAAHVAAAGTTASAGPTASPSPTASASPTASPAAADPTVVAVGDIACDPTDANFAGGAGTPDYCRAAATAALVGSGNAAVLPLGDEQYSDGTLAKFQQSYGLSWGRVTDPVRPVPGNHEYVDGSGAGYFSYFGSAAGQPGRGWYSYDVGRWHLIALNGECDFVGGCGAGSPQEQWLRADLAAHPARCTLAYWHEPLFSSGEFAEDGARTVAFWQALYDAGADVVLGGHVHDYERLAPLTPAGVRDDARGLRQFVVGTGGKNFFGFPNVLPASEVRDSGTYGVLKLTLSDGGYSWRFVPVAGQTFTDSGSATCH